MPKAGARATGGGDGSRAFGSTDMETGEFVVINQELTLNKLLADSIARAINQAAAGASPERAHELIAQALTMTGESDLTRKRRARLEAYLGDTPIGGGSLPPEQD